MSVQACKWAATISAGDKTAKAVLMVLAEAADENGKTFLGQQSIAERCCATRETVNRAMKRLQDRGLIVRSQRRREDGYRTSDNVKLTLCEPSSLDAKSHELKSHENRSHVTENRTSCDANRTAEPSDNRQIKDISSLAQPESKSQTRTKTPSDTAFEALWVAYPHFPGRSIKRRAFAAWAAMSDADRSDLVGAVCTFAGSAQAKKDNGQFVKGFHLWLHDGLWRDFIAQAHSEVNQSAIDWDARLNRFKADGVWLSSWGEKPTRDGCVAPLALLQSHGFRKPPLRVIEGGAQ